MSSAILKFIYNLITFICSFAVAVVFLFFKRGRIRLYERFGLWSEIPDNFIWFHGPSLGEIQGLIPIAERLRETFPTTPFVATVTSPTALQSAGKISEDVHLLPFDYWLWYALALKGRRPKAFIFGETEIWPALFWLLKKLNVPILLVNGRMSESSLSKYRTFNFLFQEILNNLSVVCVTDEIGKDRFAHAGVPSERICVAGNSKYDRVPQIEDKRAQRLTMFPEASFIVTIGSIRPGEEEEIFPLINHLQEKHVSHAVVLVPRHREKFEYFAQKLEEKAISFIRWNAMPATKHTSVVLVDTFGQLERLYAASDLAIIGGTLRKYGGHNPMEPAPYGIVTAIGPHCSNIADVCENLHKNDAVIKVRGAEDLVEVTNRILKKDLEIAKIGQNLFTFWQKNRGATDQIVMRIKSFIK